MALPKWISRFWSNEDDIDLCVTSMDGNSHYIGGGTRQRYRFWFKWGDPVPIDGEERSGPCP